MEFIDLKAQYAAYRDEIDEAMGEVVRNAEFIGGRYVGLLEEELAAYVGRKHCVSCGNGTDALQLAYMALGIGPGDAVFCPDMTFIASVEPAAMLGAEPVFCDIDPVSYNLSPDDLERQVERVEAEGRLRPRAVVAVDFLGNPADYGRLLEVCERRGLLLVEDAAQGIGGERGGVRLGGFGDIATTSFFPSKPLGCYGDGGAVFTDDDGTAELLRSLRVHGKGASKYDNVRIGVNSRLDNLQETGGCAALRRGAGRHRRVPRRRGRVPLGLRPVRRAGRGLGRPGRPRGGPRRKGRPLARLLPEAPARHGRLRSAAKRCLPDLGRLRRPQPRPAVLAVFNARGSGCSDRGRFERSRLNYVLERIVIAFRHPDVRSAK